MPETSSTGVLLSGIVQSLKSVERLGMEFSDRALA